MDPVLVITVLSVLCGFVCVLSAYWAFQMKGNRRLAVGLGIGALLFWTLVPVIIGVFHAALTNS